MTKLNQKNEISNAEVVDLARDCVQKYVQEMGWKSIDEVRIDVVGIYESVVYPEYDISLNTQSDLGEYSNQKILGKMIPDQKTILIDKSINQESGDPRFAFTFGHEIGHGICHLGQNAYFRCTEETIYSKERNLQELQANLFAENLIMPVALVEAKCNYYYNTKRPFRYIGAGIYCLCNRKVQIYSLAHFCWKLAMPLTSYFSNVY